MRVYVYIFTYTAFNRATEFIYPEARSYPMFSRSRAKLGELVRVINTTGDSTEISWYEIKREREEEEEKKENGRRSISGTTWLDQEILYIYIRIYCRCEVEGVEGRLPSRFLRRKKGGRREDHWRFAFETCNFRRFRPLFSRSRISPPDSLSPSPPSTPVPG